ncbi:MAG: MFS transporter [Syntrophomonadaceae bacterium]|nr:MFS transporter [Syntrophomonadaceae bacterium]
MNKLQGLSQEAVKKTLTYRYWVYLVIALAYFFVYFHRVSPAVMAPELVKSFGIDAAALGLFGSMYFYAYALGQLPSGIMADRLGVRKTMSVMVLVAGIGALIFGWASNFNMALVGRFLVGFGVGFVYVPTMRFLADWFKNDEFATYSGIMLAVGNTGALAAAAPLVAMMATIGWRSSMTSVGIISIAIAVLCYLIIRDKPEHIGGADIKDIQGLPRAASSHAISIGQAIAMTARNYNFWMISILFFVLYGSIMAFQGLWAGPFLANVYGMDKAQVGKIVSMIPIGMIFGCPISGILAGKVIKSPKKTVMIGTFVNILLWIPLIWMIDKMSPGFLSVLFFLYGFFAGWFVVMYANLKESVNPAIQGTATGFLNTWVFIGGAVCQQVTSIIVAKYQAASGAIATAGFKSAFIFLFIMLIIGLAAFATQKRPEDVIEEI